MSKRIRTLVIVAVAVVALLAASLGVAFLLPQETEEGDDASTRTIPLPCWIVPRIRRATRRPPR